MAKTITKKLHCFAEKSEGQWTAVCLDFTLAAQADNADEAISKLIKQIRCYVSDAVTGPDIAYESALLTRKAPLDQWAYYYLLKLVFKCQALFHNASERIRILHVEQPPITACH